jgi:UDP-N-acetylmuramyl pentapeptide phosphotransferase/UDP-N-acetylglucosamine-1-phosphate transferase
MKIVDRPNDRSSHSIPTIRGGGVVMIFAVIVYALLNGTHSISPIFLLSIILVGVISFVDDIKSLPSKFRFLIHSLAMSLLFFELDIFWNYQLPVLLIWYILTIGFLNIYNFMDGINGITFLNALASYLTFLVIDVFIVEFTNSDLLITLILAVGVFGFFNYRKTPLCFAGDIGSITIGLTIIYFVILLYLKTQNLSAFLILATYAIDGGCTIMERLYRGQNIFKAHKEHLYQQMANVNKISHLTVSTSYFLVQIVINLVVIFLIARQIRTGYILIVIPILLTFLYFLLKRNFITKPESL